jgi:hypothetical protein
MLMLHIHCHASKDQQSIIFYGCPQEAVWYKLFVFISKVSFYILHLHQTQLLTPAKRHLLQFPWMKAPPNENKVRRFLRDLLGPCALYIIIQQIKCLFNRRSGWLLDCKLGTAGWRVCCRYISNYPALALIGVAALAQFNEQTSITGLILQRADGAREKTSESGFDYLQDSILNYVVLLGLHPYFRCAAGHAHNRTRWVRAVKKFAANEREFLLGERAEALWGLSRRPREESDYHYAFHLLPDRVVITARDCAN